MRIDAIATGGPPASASSAVFSGGPFLEPPESLAAATFPTSQERR